MNIDNIQLENNSIDGVDIYETVARNDLDKLKKLLIHQISLDIKDKINAPFLHKIINHKVSGNETPLWAAVQNNNFEIAELLLQNGSKPNVWSANYNTEHSIMSMAIINNNKKIVKLLLTYGYNQFLASPGLNLHGKSAPKPINYAIRLKHFECANLLLAFDPHIVMIMYRGDDEKKYITSLLLQTEKRNFIVCKWWTGKIDGKFEQAGYYDPNGKIIPLINSNFYDIIQNEEKRISEGNEDSESDEEHEYFLCDDNVTELSKTLLKNSY